MIVTTLNDRVQLDMTESEALELLIAVGQISHRELVDNESWYKELHHVPDWVEVSETHASLEVWRDLKSIWDLAFRR